jgi:hypothetical protein
MIRASGASRAGSVTSPPASSQRSLDRRGKPARNVVVARELGRAQQ